MPPPRPGYFFEPTDVAWDAQGNIFISDGYQNSTVHKFDKDGHIVKLAGTTRGSAPGQFSTPHGIAVDARGNVYVADRSNARIQVLDNDLNYVREIKYDPAACGGLRLADSGFRRSRQTARYNTLWPNTLCITPGSTAVHLHELDAAGTDPEVHARRQAWSASSAPPDAKLGQFGWVHALSCVVGERNLDVGELLNWRVQKFMLKPGAAVRTSSGGR